MTTSKLLQFTNNTVTNLVNSVLLGNFLVQLGHFGTARRKLGVRLIRETENSKTCCRIYMGSPPQTTIINTRHTPPNNNYHNHSQHHQQQHQPSQPSQPTESTTPSHRVRLARLRPCCRPCAWVRPLGCIWGNVTSSPATANQQASDNGQHHGHLANKHHGTPCQRIQQARR